MVAQGVRALELIEERYLANADAADGDVRHALNALRFYHEYGPKTVLGASVPAERLHQAVRRVLARPEFAAAAVVDLARWQDWDALDEVVALYADDAPLATRRAVIGYLLSCPLPAARRELATLRERDPRGVSEAERQVNAFGGQR